MPTNGEKQPRWLMRCKCGATVKAGGCGPDDPVRVDSGADSRDRWRNDRGSDGNSPLDGPRRAYRIRYRQDCCGTIEARSNWDTMKFDAGEWRSPLRWNSIRRSNALDRI